MTVKGYDPSKQWRVMDDRDGLCAGEPTEHFVVRKVHQRLKKGDLARVHRVRLRIDEAANENIHFPHPATPSAKSEAPATNVQFAQSRVPVHRARSTVKAVSTVQIRPIPVAQP